MQHWSIAAAEVWEELLNLPYGEFYDHYQDPKKRKVISLAAILVADDYNKNSTINVQERLAEIKKLPLEELYKRIAAVYEGQGEKKSEARPNT